MSQSTPKIEVVSMVTANTEYSWTCRSKCRQVTFQNRNSIPVRYAYETGKVAGSTDPYFTLKAGAAKTLDNIQSNFTIYFACPLANQTLEIDSTTN